MVLITLYTVTHLTLKHTYNNQKINTGFYFPFTEEISELER